MMLMQKRSMKSGESLPLLICEETTECARAGLACLDVYFDAFCFDRKASIYTLNPSDKLL
jgi:hypothetical protein